MNILSKDIVKEWGMESLEETEQQDLIQRIGKILYQAVLVKSLDILSEKEEKELDSLLDANTTTPEDVVIFLQLKIPAFDKLVKEEHRKIKEDLLISNIS